MVVFVQVALCKEVFDHLLGVLARLGSYHRFLQVQLCLVVLGATLK